MSKGLAPLTVFIVPSWVRRSAQRNNVTIAELMDYRKMRKILSVNDMAEWFFLNDKFKVNNNTLSTAWLENHFTNLSPVERQEIFISVLPLSGSEEIAHSVKSRLEDASPQSQCEYELIASGNYLYVILNEGFLKACRDNEFVLNFARSYLKMCYGLTSVHEVSNFPIFRTYLNCISKK